MDFDNLVFIVLSNILISLQLSQEQVFRDILGGKLNDTFWKAHTESLRSTHVDHGRIKCDLFRPFLNVINHVFDCPIDHDVIIVVADDVLLKLIHRLYIE